MVLAHDCKPDTVLIRLRPWTEAWRTRCMLCHGTLAQSGEEGFVRELDWHWYDAVLAAADRGAMLVEGAIHRQLTIPGRCEHGLADPGVTALRAAEHVAQGLVDAEQGLHDAGVDLSP